jgi:hypothetical protein
VTAPWKTASCTLDWMSAINRKAAPQSDVSDQVAVVDIQRGDAWNQIGDFLHHSVGDGHASLFVVRVKINCIQKISVVVNEVFDVRRKLPANGRLHRHWQPANKPRSNLKPGKGAYRFVEKGGFAGGSPVSGDGAPADNANASRDCVEATEGGLP